MNTKDRIEELEYMVEQADEKAKEALAAFDAACDIKADLELELYNTKREEANGTMY